jgi:hypothetical protein
VSRQSYGECIARAGIAVATIIAAVTNATVTNKMMRLISATSLHEGVAD